MAQIIHLRCRHCGDPLASRDSRYCPPCNLYLCYRALPILLGMLMTGRLLPQFDGLDAPDAQLLADAPRGYEDKNLLVWE